MQLNLEIKSLNWWQRINLFSAALLIVSLILIPDLKPVFAILFFISSFGVGRVSEIKSIYKKPLFLIPVLFYLWHIAGILIFGWDSPFIYDIEVKLMFFLMPIAFLMSRKFIKGYKKELLLVLAGSLFLFLAISIFRSIYLNKVNYESLWFGGGSFKTNYWFYVKYTFTNHPSYFALFASLASVVILFINRNKSKLASLVLLTIPFVLIIYLAASRMGVYSYFLVLYFSVLVFYLAYKKLKQALIYLVLVSLVFGGFYKFNPRQNYFKEKIEVQKQKSGEKALSEMTEEELNNVSPRVKLWKAGWLLIKDNWLVGTGAGRIYKSLEGKNKSNGTPDHFLKHNVHNQYLETWAKTGLPGILMLLAMFVIGLWKSWKDRNYLFACFLILTGCHFLVETMLMKASGVVFFTFFYFLLIYKPQEVENNEA